MDKNYEYILAVARTGSIARAAAELYVTAPALSKYIKIKEDELGITLFDRQGKRFVLTYAGETYVNWLKKISEMEDSMHRDLNRLAKGENGQLILGFPMALTRRLTSSIIPTFKQRYPGIEVIMKEAHSMDLLSMTLNNQVDFAFMAEQTYPDQLEALEFTKDELILALPAHHPLIQEAIHVEGLRYPFIDIQKAAGEPFISFDGERILGKYTHQIFNRFDFHPPTPIQVRTVETAIQCVKNGLGLAIMFDNPLKVEEFRDSIVSLSFENNPVHRSLFLVRHKDHVITKEMKAFMEVTFSIE